MNAREAREHAQLVINDARAKEAAKIDDAIKEAVKNGKMNCAVYGWIKDPNLLKLNEEGYTVSMHSDRDGTQTRISW